MIAQLSENIHLMPVFTDMLNEKGAEIYLKPVEEYIKTGVEVNFYTVVEAAARRNETAIGYRSASADEKSDSYGVHINPDKSAVITFNPGDKVIVFAE
jgi:hypothetical protein